MRFEIRPSQERPERDQHELEIIYNESPVGITSHSAIFQLHGLDLLDLEATIHRYLADRLAETSTVPKGPRC